MKKEQLYLFRLFSYSKTAFVLLILFAGITLYQSLKSREEFPFLLYGMYSLPEKKKDLHTTYEIVIDGKQVIYSDLWDTQRELIQSPLYAYASLITEGKLTEQQLRQYKSWMYRYCADMRMTENNVMQVYQLDCVYSADGKPEIKQRKLLFTYDDHEQQ